MFPFNLLMMVLNRSGEPEKQPWEKDNSWLINAGIKDIMFKVTPLSYKSGYDTENISTSISDIVFGVQQVYYKSMYEAENLLTSITDISFVVTKTGANPL